MRILHIDDDEQSRRVVAQVIEGLLGHKVVVYKDAQEALDHYLTAPYPIVITDIRMPGLNGLNLLQKIKSSPTGAETDVVLITGFADLDSAVTALREGAADYLRKPVKASELMDVVKRLVMNRSLRDIQEVHGSRTADTAGLPPDRQPGTETSVLTLPDGARIGIFSPAIHTLVETALRFHEDRTVPVMIQGETGTGKDLFASLIHYGKERSTLPYLSVNCSAIAPTLFDSELFGYVGGAFTGAKRSGAKGMFEAADGGSIFLDEISEIPLSMQPKLLRALQEKAIYRVGSTRRIALDFRLITATNQDLEMMMEAGRFRHDLFYRLNVGRIVVPPLRKQQSAIAPLAQMFLTAAAHQKNRHFRHIHTEAVHILENHPWPGNVRELRNVIENVVLLFDDIELKPEHLSAINWQTSEEESDTFDISYPFTLRLPKAGMDLELLNREIVKKALKIFDGNQAKTAQYLGMSRYALRSRLKKLGQ